MTSKKSPPAVAEPAAALAPAPTPAKTVKKKVAAPAVAAAPVPAPAKIVKKKVAAPKAAAAKVTPVKAEAPADAAILDDKAKGKKKVKGKKHKKNKKEAVIIRFEDDQLPLIDTRAEALGLSRAAWVRMVVSRALAEAV